MRARSLHTAALGAAIAILAVVAPVVRAGAAPAAACTSTAGVTVIVDFTHFGSAIERGCAAGQPATALDAMHAAGFETAGTTRYGDAFLCRIDDLPAPKNEACADTPPASSSWSFYNARPNDATWTYAAVGVLSYRPPSGSIIAFAFGNFAKPGIRPTAAIPRATTTVTVADPTVPAAPPAEAPPTQSAPTIAPPATARVTAPRTPATHAKTTVVAATVPASTTSTATHIVDRTATGTIPHDSSGSPVPAAITAAIVVLLAAGAGVTISARRRRSA
jgi:hypothetical protein